MEQRYSAAVRLLRYYIDILSKTRENFWGKSFYSEITNSGYFFIDLPVPTRGSKASFEEVIASTRKRDSKAKEFLKSFFKGTPMHPIVNFEPDKIVYKFEYLGDHYVVNLFLNNIIQYISQTYGGEAVSKATLERLFPALF